MKTIPLINLIKEIRDVVTKPTLKSPTDAKAAFISYVEKKHCICDLTTKEGVAYLDNLKTIGPIKHMLEYMGVS